MLFRSQSSQAMQLKKHPTRGFIEPGQLMLLIMGKL